MSEPTARQRQGMAEYVAEVARRGIDMLAHEPGRSSWQGPFKDEVRPGRGHSFSGVWCDGEYFVQVSLDVYGNGYLSIEKVDWAHGGEDCECDACREDLELAIER